MANKKKNKRTPVTKAQTTPKAPAEEKSAGNKKHLNPVLSYGLFAAALVVAIGIGLIVILPML